MSYLIAVITIPALLIFLWRRRSYKDYTCSILINAPVDVVWALVDSRQHPDIAASRGLRFEATGEPDVFSLSVSNETGQVLFVNRLRYYPTPAEFMIASRVEERHFPAWNKTVSFPWGEDSVLVSVLEPTGNAATRLFLFERLRTNLFENLDYRYFMSRNYLRKIRDLAERRLRRPSILTRGSIWKIGSTLTALAASIWQFGWIEGLALVFVIVLHEIGHALGFRAVGEKVLGIHLIPFFGGITIGTSPKTALKSAIVSLSGTTFSLCAATLLFAGVWFSGLPVELWPDVAFEPNFGGALVLGVGGMLLLNLMQLLPVSFLDGGRTLEAALSGMPLKMRRTIMPLAGIAVVIALYLLRQPTVAITAFFFVAFGVVFDAARGEGKNPGFLPATLKSSLAIGGLYLSHVSLYAGMIVWLTLTFFSPSLEAARALAPAVEDAYVGETVAEDATQ